MCTEGRPGPDGAIKFDEVREEAALLSLIQDFEDQKAPLIFLEAKLESWANIKTALLALRSSNVSGMLLLQKSEEIPTLSEIETAITYLKEWDQLFLQNIILLGDPWISARHQKALATEARIELKWFREWFAASTDCRVAKYPGLPWRSFIRKTINENYLFAMQLIHSNVADPDLATNETDGLIQAFLNGKKKAINTFPKKWGKFQ